MTKAEKDAAKAVEPTDKEAAPSDEFKIEVQDPEVFRPTELPLLITPPAGKGWKNPEQAEYAKVLNAYAYRNPTKWLGRKNAEIARLLEIGDHPEKYYVYSGAGDGKLKVVDKLISNQL